MDCRPQTWRSTSVATTKGRVSTPFGRLDCTVLRKFMSTKDTIHESALTLDTEAKARAFRVVLQLFGDLCKWDDADDGIKRQVRNGGTTPSSSRHVQLLKRAP